MRKIIGLIHSVRDNGQSLIWHHYVNTESQRSYSIHEAPTNERSKEGQYMQPFSNYTKTFSMT